MRTRLDLDCALAFANQTEFPEPATRINTAQVDSAALGWSETAAWDQFAAYYDGVYRAG
jgi:hypothetical protein